MNTTHTNKKLNAEPTIANRCVQSCKKLLAEIERAKNKITDEFRDTVESHQNLFHLALREAEALAWQTAYPHLVFPVLAVEKVQAMAERQTRQQSLHQRGLVFAEAA